MPASEQRETSYYEVSLTNRQVMVAFAFLLVGLLVSFLSGVWVGKTAVPVAAEEPPGLRVVEEEPIAAPAPATAEPAAGSGQVASASPPEAENDGVPRLDYFQEGAADASGEVASQSPESHPPPTIEVPAVVSTPGAQEPARPERVAAASPPGPAPASASPPVASSTGPVKTPPAAAPGPAAGAAPAAPAAEKPKWRQRAELASEAQRLESEFAREEAELGAPGPAPGSQPAPAAPLPPAASSAETAAAPAPRPAPPPARTGAPQFMVQVFSSKDAVKSREILSSLQDAGYPASLTRSELASGVTYRVRIGPFRDRPAAQKVAEDVSRRMKMDTWITTE